MVVVSRPYMTHVFRMLFKRKCTDCMDMDGLDLWSWVMCDTEGRWRSLEMQLRLGHPGPWTIGGPWSARPLGITFGGSNYHRLCQHAPPILIAVGSENVPSSCGKWIQRKNSKHTLALIDNMLIMQSLS